MFWIQCFVTPLNIRWVQEEIFGTAGLYQIDISVSYGSHEQQSSPQFQYLNKFGPLPRKWHGFWYCGKIKLSFILSLRKDFQVEIICCMRFFILEWIELCFWPWLEYVLYHIEENQWDMCKPPSRLNNPSSQYLNIRLSSCLIYSM